MATYVSLLSFTEQGIKNIRESPGRLDAARKAFQGAGGELKQWYLAFGKYDAIVISELPNDEAAAKLALTLGAQGNVRTQTTRVFTESEYRKLIQSL
jgi:uncharacterized protein with GYD domain